MTIESLVQDPLFSLTASRSEQDWDRIEQAERAASSYITTPRDAELNDRIDGLIRRVLTRKDLNAELSRENRLKGRAEIIVGGSGAGKTRAIEKAILRQSSLRPTDGAEPTRPLLSINAPENPSPRALYMRLLNATGYPLVSVPSTEVVLQRFKSQALKLEVVIIHVDDAANLIVGQDSFRRRRAAERMAACFRGLMEDDNPISLIISGLDPVLDLVRYDEAFGRRAEVLNFYPVRENEIKSLARTIHDRAKTAGLAFAPEKEMIERLVHAASGQLGLALEMFLWQAMAVATERCTSAAAPRNLESVDFAAIYHRRTACGFGLNVFETPDWRRIDTSETIPPNSGRSVHASVVAEAEMTLLARVELMPDELAQVSYVSRLAAVCGCPTAAKFCQEVGLDWTSIRKGKPEALAPLAEVSGADLDRLTRNSIVEVGPRSYELRGCHAISNMFRTAEYALCPVCVADDLASGSGANAYDRVHLRIAWHLRAIETCHVHDRKLITCPLKSIRNERRDFATFGWDAAYQWASKPPEAVVQRPTPFELYLIARLDGKAGSTWLDEMPMSEVTRVCEFFGSAIATGEFRRRRHLENDAIRAIRDVGFRSLKSGPEALQDVLTAKLASLGDTSRFVSISNIIGPMAELLVDRENQTTDFWHFRHEVQKFVESNLPDQVLRVSLPSSAGPFRLRDIAERTRLSQDALARAAHRLGLEQTSDEQFETLPARRIVREARNLWTNRQVRSMLGVTNEILWVLADSSLLGKVHRSQVHKANRRFEPAAIEAFAEKLRALPSSERTESDNWVSIVNAALRARCGVDVVVGMLLNGTIRKVLRDRDENGLASIRVCGLEVFSARFGVPWSGLSMRQTAKNLGATFEVVSALIAQGALVHCRARAGATDAVFVSEESLRDFKHRYVSLAELAKLSGGSAIKLNKELAEKGIAPAISREQCGASYFRRDDIRL